MNISNQSEIARLKAQFELENAACWYALHAPSSGVAKHTFILQKMETMGMLQEELKRRIGEERTAKFVVRTMSKDQSK